MYFPNQIFVINCKFCLKLNNADRSVSLKKSKTCEAFNFFLFCQTEKLQMHVELIILWGVLQPSNEKALGSHSIFC